MESRDHVVFGALLHDIGKFFERAERLGDYRNDDDQKQQDCRWNKDGYWSHLHVLNTRRFCEWLVEQCPILTPPEYQRDKAADQHWINFAARHHNVSSVLERLVAAADHFASAEREQGSYYESQIHKRTRLEALLERIDLQSTSKPTRYRLPLQPLALSEEALFPVAVDGFEIPMQEAKTDHGSVWLSPKPLLDDYQHLADSFLSALSQLPQYDKASPAALHSLMHTLLAQMERFLSSVPAATNVIHADISLYDHLRVTAAIAEGLYLHHEANNTLDQPEQFHDRQIHKWRLVCGDFSGIQKFIYNITRKGAAKGLRGRSLYIQLLCDGVAGHLIKQLGLYPSAKIYSSGGKFYLLIADCLEQQLRKEIAAINAELIKAFQGEVFLGVGIASVCGEDFQGGNMGRCWKAANEDLMRDRLQRFRPVLENNLDFFAPQELAPGQACSVCGRDDAGADIRQRDNNPTCHQCRELQDLGGVLKDTSAFFWAWQEDQNRAQEMLRGAKSFAIPGTGWRVYALTEKAPASALRNLTGCYLETLNDISDPDANPNGYACSYRLLGKWDTAKESRNWEFDDFDSEAKGIQRLGVLRLDVDNLGEIFIRGLKFPAVKGEQTEMGSLSRVATLSRQLNLFFAGYLTSLLSAYQRTQIIYAGGDDVFLIGSWDELPEVACQLRQTFSRYCANNPVFTPSGGMAMVDGRYPISRAADMAGEAEHQAKTLKRNGQEKDAISLIDTAIGWEEYPVAKQMLADIQAIIDKSNGNRAILDRLRSVVLSVEEFQRLGARQSLREDELRELMHWQRWRWRLVYNLTRMAKRNPDIKEQLDDLVQTITNSGAYRERAVLDWLALPTRWAEFLTRRTKQ
ncbi:MAG: type III-A CRISPR-associated protein Cas10/Csm1 [Candidatus Competibacteraceae bacterium]|nr:type III-A CRISPR-associated protein Cas10/Csm1 [Candidatus Competibacteraceae bacterium]